MSAGTASSGGSANMEEVMLTIKKQVIIEMLSTFLQYAKQHWTKEAYNYLAINFILVMFATTSKHPNPKVVLGVTPQSWVQATFGQTGISTRPDWTAEVFEKARPRKEPRLAFIWEDKSLNLAPDVTKYLSVSLARKRVMDAVGEAIPLHLKQLRKQAMCAFCRYKEDVFYTFLTFRDCFSLFKWVRASNWDAMEVKYGARFEGEDKKEWARDFDDEDLPVPTAPYSCVFFLDDAQTELSIYLRNAFKMATAPLGFVHDQNPLFQLPPGITEEELKQPGRNMAQEAIDALSEEEEPEPQAAPDPSAIDDIVKDPNFHPGSQETSLATSSGSCDTAGASEPPLSPVHIKVPTGGAGPSERGARHIARQERADAAQEPEEQSIVDASEESATANASAELPLDANAGLSLSAGLVFDPDEAQASSTPVKPAALAPAPVRRAVVALAESSETEPLDAVAPNADPANALPPTNDPVAPADAHEPIPDDGSANAKQPGAEQATAGPSNEGQSSQPTTPALIARPKRKKTAKAAGAHAPDDAPNSGAGGPVFAGPSNVNAALIIAAPAGQSTRSSSRIKAQGSDVNNQSQSVDAPAADGAAKARTSKKRLQPADNQGIGNAAAAPSDSKKRKLAPAAQALDDAPGLSNTQRRVNPPRNCKTGGKKKIQ